MVFGLSVRHLVDAEPLIRGAKKSRQVLLDIFDIVQLGRERVTHVDSDDLPVGLAFVEECHNTEDLDLLDLARVRDLPSDLTDVERVVVADLECIGVLDVGVFPGLRERTVVVNVSVVREAVAHVAKLALLDVLLDGVERFLLRDLY